MAFLSLSAWFLVSSGKCSERHAFVLCHTGFLHAHYASGHRTKRALSGTLHQVQAPNTLSPARWRNSLPQNQWCFSFLLGRTGKTTISSFSCLLMNNAELLQNFTLWCSQWSFSFTLALRSFLLPSQPASQKIEVGT